MSDAHAVIPRPPPLRTSLHRACLRHRQGIPSFCAMSGAHSVTPSLPPLRTSLHRACPDRTSLFNFLAFLSFCAMRDGFLALAGLVHLPARWLFFRIRAKAHQPHLISVAAPRGPRGGREGALGGWLLARTREALLGSLDAEPGEGGGGGVRCRYGPREVRKRLRAVSVLRCEKEASGGGGAGRSFATRDPLRDSQYAYDLRGTAADSANSAACSAKDPFALLITCWVHSRDTLPRS
jgi:hypothetical protein